MAADFLDWSGGSDGSETLGGGFCVGGGVIVWFFPLLLLLLLLLSEGMEVPYNVCALLAVAKVWSETVEFLPSPTH